jgi:hypothetical protein
VATSGPKWSSVTEAARTYISVARAQGLDTSELLHIIKEMT